MPGPCLATGTEVNINTLCVRVCSFGVSTGSYRNPPTDKSPILVKVTHFECWEKHTFKKLFPVQTRAGVGLSGSGLRHHSQCQVTTHFYLIPFAKK